MPQAGGGAAASASPLERGKLESWAAGIVYALGSVNFLFDPSQDPHLSAGEVCAAFGVSTSTGAAKAKQIRDLFRMLPMDASWCLPSKLEESPTAWLISVNGLILDARRAPRPIQEEAFRRGLIPYVPGDGAKGESVNLRVPGERVLQVLVRGDVGSISTPGPESP